MRCSLTVLVEVDPDYPYAPWIKGEEKRRRQEEAAIDQAWAFFRRFISGKVDYPYPFIEATRVADIGVDKAIEKIRDLEKLSEKLERYGREAGQEVEWREVFEPCTSFFADATAPKPVYYLRKETEERIRRFPERFWLVTLWYHW